MQVSSPRPLRNKGSNTPSCTPRVGRAPLRRLTARSQHGVQQENVGAAGTPGSRSVLHGLRERLRHGLGAAAGAALGAAGAAVLLTTPAPASAQTLHFPIADSFEVFGVQKTLLEAWSIVTQTFVDPNVFRQVGWDTQLASALETAAASNTADEAAKQIPELLSKLGDPYTRWAPPMEYSRFRVSSDGEVQGVGLLIAADPSSGRLVVLAPIKGSPAERAGIRPGDELLNVGGASSKGWSADQAAAHLRGERGSAVWVKVARHRELVPGQVAGARTLFEGDIEYKQFKLQREKVELPPIFATAMHTDDEHTFGYIRLVSFSQHAAEDMRKAIVQLRRDGAESFILDLRNNPGGLVRSSLDVAGLWMSGSEHPTIFTVEERGGDGSQLQQVALDEGTAEATEPLVVLVNKNSASASEILAGALHDNRRAEVLGDPTFGKGKIQSVFELTDGSALFVTVAKYKTPDGHEIDKVGVRPDSACKPQGATASGLSYSGIPIGPGADEKVITELESDDCVLHAEQVLSKKLERNYQARPAMQLASAPSPKA